MDFFVQGTLILALGMLLDMTVLTQNCALMKLFFDGKQGSMWPVARAVRVVLLTK